MTQVDEEHLLNKDLFYEIIFCTQFNDCSYMVITLQQSSTLSKQTQSNQQICQLEFNPF